jgi:Sulfotransferase family
MDAAGVVPLDENSLLNSAIATTGLEDFGSDEWREPFSILIKSLEEEADLNLMGRIRTRSELLHSLEARLRIEDTYKRHPEIEDQEITQPIIVVGQGRSGTSFLINVLAANPDYGALSHWEAMFPCPPPEAAGYHSDPRIVRCHKLIDQWNRVTPTLTSMHEFAGHLPTEDCEILAMSFMSPTWFDALGQVPRYDAYMMQKDMAEAMQYHKRVLQLLQWKNPRKHWVLKDPMHLDRLDTVLKVYPDACFVWPHRDPVRALASMISMCGTCQWGRSDYPFKGGSWEYLTDPNYSAMRLNAVIDKLESGSVPESQFHHLLYQDLVTQPLKCIDDMHKHFGIAPSDAGMAGMARYLTQHPRDARPPHQFIVDEDTIALAHKAYQRYRDYFGIPVES